MKDIEIRLLTSIDDMNIMQQVEETVWSMPPIPVHQTYTATHNGGIYLGAFIDKELIGFLNSFPGYDPKTKKAYLCSHMMGILPEHRHRGLGRILKLKQAEIAKEMGYEMITWTFDPLESRNAYLNIHKLGATGAIYLQDHYGSLNDSLNQGLPTDRIIIKWDITKEHQVHKPELDENKILLRQAANQEPVLTEAYQDDLASGVWLVEIPEDFQTMKKDNFELAKNWRYQVREVFEKLFAIGYQATNILRIPEKNQSYYVFSLNNEEE